VGATRTPAAYQALRSIFASVSSTSGYSRNFRFVTSPSRCSPGRSNARRATCAIWRRSKLRPSALRQSVVLRAACSTPLRISRRIVASTGSHPPTPRISWRRSIRYRIA